MLVKTTNIIFAKIAIVAVPTLKIASVEAVTLTAVITTRSALVSQTFTAKGRRSTRARSSRTWTLDIVLTQKHL
jgi:hypothetical protein